MLLIEEEEWQFYGISSGLHRFFIMVWEEILSDETPDTWQIRTSNVLSVLNEIIDVLDVVEEHDLSRHNVPVLLAEAAAMIQIDPIIPKHFPFVTDYLPKWGAAGLGPDQNLDGSADLRELRKRVNVIVGQLQTYHQHAINDLRDVLRVGDPKHKNEVHQLAMAVAVGWSVMGYSRQHLSDVSDLLDSSESDFIARFDRFIRRCDGVKRKYQCRFGLNWPGDVLPSTGFVVPGVKLTKGVPSGLISDQERQFYGRPNPEDVFAELSVEAFDPVSAYRTAEAKLSSVLAAINLYFTNKRFEFKGTIALVSDGEQTFAPKIERKRLFKSPLDRANAAIHVKRFLDLLHGERLDSEDIDQMASALQYHRLALGASTDESRLVNLWIALECLARREHSSIIGAVCRYIAPSTAIGNVQKLLRNVAYYISDYARWKKRSIPTDKFPNSTSETICIPDLLDALLDVEDGVKITALYELVGDHELIRFRVFRLRKKTLASSSKTADTMKFHMQNVEWQLRRIYRARNHITHSGRGSAILPHLIRHLHAYFVETFNNVVVDMQRNADWSMRDALAHRHFLFGHYLSSLDGKGKSPISKEALLDPEKTLFAMTGMPAWPETPGVSKDARKSSAVVGRAPSNPSLAAPAPTSSTPLTAVLSPTPTVVS